MTIEDLANSLTPGQYIELLNIAYGPIPEEIRNLSDEELLQKLEK